MALIAACDWAKSQCWLAPSAWTTAQAGWAVLTYLAATVTTRCGGAHKGCCQCTSVVSLWLVACQHGPRGPGSLLQLPPPLRLVRWPRGGQLAARLARRACAAALRACLCAQGGNTALHHACGSGHAHVAQMLLEAGARHDARQKLGATPLHQACTSGHTSVARVLLRAGAQVDARENCQIDSASIVRPGQMGWDRGCCAGCPSAAAPCSCTACTRALGPPGIILAGGRRHHRSNQMVIGCPARGMQSRLESPTCPTTPTSVQLYKGWGLWSLLA